MSGGRHTDFRLRYWKIEDGVAAPLIRNVGCQVGDTGATAEFRDAGCQAYGGATADVECQAGDGVATADVGCQAGDAGAAANVGCQSGHGGAVADVGCQADDALVMRWWYTSGGGEKRAVECGCSGCSCTAPCIAGMLSWFLTALRGTP